MLTRREGKPFRWLFCLVLLFLAGTLQAQPWVQNFNAVRTFWVSPSGSGTGTQSNPMGISTAMSQALPVISTG